MARSWFENSLIKRLLDTKKQRERYVYFEILIFKMYRHFLFNFRQPTTLFQCIFKDRWSGDAILDGHKICLCSEEVVGSLFQRLFNFYEYVAGLKHVFHDSMNIFS